MRSPFKESVRLVYCCLFFFSNSEGEIKASYRWSDTMIFDELLVNKKRFSLRSIDNICVCVQLCAVWSMCEANVCMWCVCVRVCVCV